MIPPDCGTPYYRYDGLGGNTWSLRINGRPTDADLDRYEAIWNCWIIKIFRHDERQGDSVLRIYELIMSPRGHVGIGSEQRSEGIE